MLQLLIVVKERIGLILDHVGFDGYITSSGVTLGRLLCRLPLEGLHMFNFPERFTLTKIRVPDYDETGYQITTPEDWDIVDPEGKSVDLLNSPHLVWSKYLPSLKG